MKSIFTAFLTLLFIGHTSAQNMGSGSFNTCTPGTLYDPGGAGNYGNNLDITETYCSNNIPVDCIQFTFTSFNTENNYDDLTIYDGPTATGTPIGTYDDVALPNGGTITSTTGCLTFVFHSDGSINRPGFEANYTCVPCPVPTCSDGIQNQGELGVDCGGPCAACPAEIIPTACATQLFNIVTDNKFYDDGGAGGDLCGDGHANNFANANCETTTTICAPPGQSILVDFNTFAMFNTNSAFDWMKIYEGSGTGGTILFDNDVGGISHPGGSGYGDCGDEDLTVVTGLCSNTSNCLTFEFHASSVVSRAGWDADVHIATGINCANILPIELVNFNGEAQSNSNYLSWHTKSELNNDYFELERSDDGVNFITISKINGAGTSNSTINYEFSDFNFKQEVEYYRLKQVDFNGDFSFSNIVAIQNNRIEYVSIYPNPTQDVLNIDFGNISDGNITVVITDAMGHVIRKELTLNNHHVEINNLRGLSLGVYFIQVLDKNGDLLHQEKLIKQ